MNNIKLPENLLKIFNSIIPVDELLIAAIEKTLHYKKITKHDILLKQGQVSKYIYFIEKGLIRSYYNEGDTEVTTWFMKETDLIISVKSFFMQVETVETLQALEDCELYFISFESMHHLYKQFNSFNTIGRVLTQHYYMLSEERLLHIRKKDALEKYKHLLIHHPEIVLRSPLKYIASYLGITIETLSRLRAKRI